METTDLDQSGMQRVGDSAKFGEIAWVTVDEASIILAGKAGAWRDWQPRGRWALQTLIKADLTERFGRNFFMPYLETYPCLTHCHQ